MNGVAEGRSAKPPPAWRKSLKNEVPFRVGGTLASALPSEGVHALVLSSSHIDTAHDWSQTMSTRIFPRFETPLDGLAEDPAVGLALARVIDAHPALAPLLDFCAVDPHQIAVAVGMVYPYEEDGLSDLDDLDFGPDEWFEPVAGLAVLSRAITAVRDDPQSLAAAIYDPGLRPADALADLEAIAAQLEAARQHETRFHFRETV